MEITVHEYPVGDMRRAVFWSEDPNAPVVYDLIEGGSTSARQYFRGTEAISIFGETNGEVTELLNVVSGSGELVTTKSTISVAGSPA